MDGSASILDFPIAVDNLLLSDSKPFMCWGWTTSDIVYFWHGGVTVKYHILDPTTGGYECIYLGPNLADGNTMQVYSTFNNKRGSQTPFLYQYWMAT